LRIKAQGAMFAMTNPTPDARLESKMGTDGIVMVMQGAS
jgi:hypothetical protein